MTATEKSALSISRRFEILCLLLSEKNPGDLYDDMNLEEIIEAKEFILEKVMEFGIQRKGAAFSAAEISNKLSYLNRYPAEKGCRKPVSMCNGTDCYDTHRDCSMSRLKLETESLFQLAQEYLRS